MTAFKPLLAEAIESIDGLSYPLAASIKYDGIRAIARDGVLLSRSLKPIPNRFVQTLLGRPEFNGLDGELMVHGTFQAVTSAFMSVHGAPDFYFAVFDNVTNPDAPFSVRYASLLKYPTHPRIKIVPQTQCNNPTELRTFYEGVLAAGHEGAMVRSLDGRYKFGRSTLKEGILLKWKPFSDDEAKVVGFEERLHNANEATTNALGRTERSSHQANLIPMGTLGALVCQSPKWAGTFNIGTGFTDAQRNDIWDVRYDYLNRIVKFKYQAIGTVDKPRIPVFLGWRDPRDL